MGKVETISAQEILDVYKKNRSASEVVLTSALLNLVKDRVNELIEAHNEHVEMCKRQMSTATDAQRELINDLAAYNDPYERSEEVDKAWRRINEKRN